MKTYKKRHHIKNIINRKTSKQKIKLYRFSVKRKNKLAIKKSKKSKLKGGISEQQIQIENYRYLFIKKILNILQFESSNNIDKLNNSVKSFIEFLKNNKKYINTLIPVDINGNIVMKQSINKEGVQQIKTIYDNSKIDNFVSPIVIILNNIKNNEIKKQIISVMKSLESNINLPSSKIDKKINRKITALDNELNKEILNTEIIVFLLNIGANLDQLTRDDKIIQKKKIKDMRRNKIEPLVKLNNYVEEELLTKPNEENNNLIIEQPTDIKRKDDLIIIPTTLEEKYDLTNLNDELFNNSIKFWFPLFNPNELLMLKQKISDLYDNDNIPEILEEFNYRPKKGDINYNTFYEEKAVSNRREIFFNKWNNSKICKIVKNFMKNYDTSKDVIYKSGMYEVQDGPDDTLIFNILLCTVFLILGIISKKLEGQNYYILFKGGKAIQLDLMKSNYKNLYSSDDIDVIVIQKEGYYNIENVRNIALHISKLIQWLIIPQSFRVDMSIREDNADDKKIFKLSYIKKVGGFKAISDIGYGKLYSDVEKYFKYKRLDNEEFYIPELQEKALFIFQKKHAMVSEKIYLLIKYIVKKDITNDEKSKKEFDYLIYKFKKAIIPLTEAIIINEYPNIIKNEEETKKREEEFLNEKIKETIDSINKNYNQQKEYIEISEYLKTINLDDFITKIKKYLFE